MNTKVDLAMYIEGDKMLAEVRYFINIELNEQITEGRKINIRLENGEIISISSNGNASPKSNLVASSHSASVTTTYLVTYKVTKEFLEKLASNKPVAIQIELFDNEEVVKELKNKKAENFMEDAACLLKLM